MDLTDINPTIISTDTDEETNAEMAPGASGTLSRGSRKRRRSIKLSFKNPVVSSKSLLLKSLLFII